MKLAVLLFRARRALICSFRVVKGQPSSPHSDILQNMKLRRLCAIDLAEDLIFGTMKLCVSSQKSYDRVFQASLQQLLFGTGARS